MHAKTPEASGLPAPITDSTGTGSGTSGGSGVGLKARPGSRSSPKTGSRLQNASKSGTATTMVADSTALTKQNQSREQAEKKNQAVNQLRRLLIQGNKRVEALATVIQHLFTEVLHSFYAHDGKKKSFVVVCVQYLYRKCLYRNYICVMFRRVRSQL